MTDKEDMVEGSDAGSAGAVGDEQRVEAEARQGEPEDSTVARLEQAVADKDGEISALRLALGDTEKKLSQLNATLTQTVDTYKALTIESNPGVPAELIAGKTVGEVNESLKNARGIIDRVRQEMEAEASRMRIPAGAPQRSPLDLSGLSPREKIQYAIGGKR